MQIIDVVTWKEALIGGAIIGLSSSFLLLANGKIAGISGILGGIFTSKKNDRLWRIMFLAGLVIGGIIIYMLAPQNTLQASIPSNSRAVIAAVLVGIGTALGSGCTSGHGVCGISRFSMRSIVATLTFMATGFLTLYFGW